MTSLSFLNLTGGKPRDSRDIQEISQSILEYDDKVFATIKRHRLFESPNNYALLKGASVSILVCLLISVPVPGHAQDWNFDPTVTLAGTYNDNIRLSNTPETEDELSGGDVAVSAHIFRRSPTGSISLHPRIRSSYYPNNPEEESTDAYLDFIAQHRGQTSQWSLVARYADDEVLTSEVGDPDFDNPEIDRPITDDSGRVQIKNRRRRYALSSGAVFDISERTSIGVFGDYVDVGYEDLSEHLTDYSNVRLETNISYKISQRNTCALQVFGSRYEVDEPESSSDGLGASLECRRQWSPRMSGYASAGYNRTESSSGLQQGSAGSTIFSLGMERTYETNRLLLDIRSSVDPTGEGRVVERHQIRGLFAHQLSPLLAGSILARYQLINSVGEEFGEQSLDRDYFYTILALNWRIKRAWYMTIGYAYTWQKYANDSNSAASNRLHLGLTYSPHRRDPLRFNLRGT